MRALEEAEALAKTVVDHTHLVQFAYELGLRWRNIPNSRSVVRRPYSWDIPEFAQEYKYEIKFYLEEVSADGRDWHGLYRTLREHGWTRKLVHREGGKLTYVLEHYDPTFPKGYQRRFLLLNIIIQTCRRIQVGTKMEEVPIYETVCEDIVEPEPTDESDPRENTQG
jgi:hypothetical protein